MARRENPRQDQPEEGTRIYGGDFVDAVSEAYDEAGYNQGYDEYQGYGYDQSYDQGYDYQEPYDDEGYDDGYQDYDYYEDYQRPQRPTMAARAAGKASSDPYGYQRQSQPRQQTRQARQSQPRQRQTRARQYDYYDEPQPVRKRRKKRHPFRNFLIFVLVLVGLGYGAYSLIFQAPDQTSDGIHTRKDGFYNILLCATDEEEMRTDTIMIATLDSKNGDISITSIPRDTIVSNGEAVPKINGVYGLAGGGDAGAQALMNEVETLLGFRPDGYAVINYQVFRDAVNAMGGVTFDVPMDMEVEGMTISAGEQLLDGETALAVCRYRYGYAMADIQRQYVQQNFVKAMAKQCLSLDKLTSLPAVYDAVMANTLTDLSGANIRYLVLKVLLSGMADIQQNTLPGEGVNYNGASCYGLFGQSVVDMVNETMNPYAENLTIDDVYILTVSGGYLVESTWTGTAFDASTYVYQ